MQDPNANNKPPKQHPLIDEVAGWVIDLTDGAETPQKKFLEDTSLRGHTWLDDDGQLHTPIGLNKKEADGTTKVLTAKSAPEGGEATLTYVPLDHVKKAA
ncbi:MAG: hypothetical protein H6799_01110 [Candidatus Nomurabacteria bacterium]|nr:MAG: hypothetical protein H6799_01110 [Candidatus Nomurabacteria bacterium]